MILFNNKTDLETQLLADIVLIISDSIETYGDARILLSGGSTPKGLYQKLVESDIPWQAVHIGLVDDRNVPISDEYSNEKMIRDIFKDKNLTDVEIYSMLTEEDNLSEIEQNYAPFFERIDLCLLGMGTDGHTASLFPEDDTSESLLKSEQISINYTTAPQYPTKRITCSKGLLKQSTNLILMMIGEEKRTVFVNCHRNIKPISYFVKECPNLKTYYTN
jgi:6-phosphogluconolactonase